MFILAVNNSLLLALALVPGSFHVVELVGRDVVSGMFEDKGW